MVFGLGKFVLPAPQHRLPAFFFVKNGVWRRETACFLLASHSTQLVRFPNEKTAMEC